MILNAEFDLGQRVHIDGDKSWTGVVNAILWRGGKYATAYSVAWIANGVSHEPYIDAHRLTALEGA